MPWSLPRNDRDVQLEAIWVPVGATARSSPQGLL
jgi:hypothetical protein